MSNKKLKETHEGIFEWIDAGHGAGFWAKQEDPQTVHDRVPFACRACGNMLYNFDHTYHLRYGVCANCHVDYLDGRENLPHFKNNDARTEYVKQKIAEKKSIA